MGQEYKSITLFRSITMCVGLTIFYRIFSIFDLNDRIICRIILTPHNIVVDLNNVMRYATC